MLVSFIYNYSFLINEYISLHVHVIPQFNFLRSRCSFVRSFIHLGAFKIFRSEMWNNYSTNKILPTLPMEIHFTPIFIYTLVTNKKCLFLFLNCIHRDISTKRVLLHLTWTNKAHYESRTPPLSDNQTRRATNNRFSWYLISIAALPSKNEAKGGGERNEERFIRSVPIFSLPRNHHHAVFHAGMEDCTRVSSPLLFNLPPVEF